MEGPEAYNGTIVKTLVSQHPARYIVRTQDNATSDNDDRGGGELGKYGN